MILSGKKKIAKLISSILFAVVISLLVVNMEGLDDWSRYLHGSMHYRHVYKPEIIECEDPEYGIICSLAKAINTDRMNIIKETLNDLGVAYDEIPIDGFDLKDIIVRFDTDQSENTVLTAHYDKSINDVTYQGGMDNTASIIMLLSLVKDLKSEPPKKSTIIVFSGMEEFGFFGAEAFAEYSANHKIRIREIINFDCIGRGEPYIGAIGKESGLIFDIPILGRYSYNNFKRSDDKFVKVSGFSEPNKRIIEGFRKTGVPFRVYNRMLGWGEDTYYAELGLDTARIYSDDIYYYFRNIDTYDDLIENIDRKNIEKTKLMIHSYLNLD